MPIKTNINDFLKKFKASETLVLEVSKKTFNEGILNLYRNIVQRTPVGNPALWKTKYVPKGYTPGQLKDSWTFSNTGEYSATISNNQPYAQRVEEGWSTQAPQGMMRISIFEWSSILDKQAAKYKIR